MKKISSIFLVFLCSLQSFSVAQQVPNAGFEDWSGAAFDGKEQPASWNASNVTQFGFKFNFAHKEAGHSGSYSMMVQDQDVKAAGIGETSPGYFSLGQPWVYVKSLKAVSEATAGTEGGISWNYRPDTMSVWIRRTGANVDKEDFYLLYYAWTGTAKSSKYKGKNGNCTAVSKTNEESDIRQALDGNECGTDQKANQVAEGLWREKKEYAQWTNIRVPIYYFNSDVPTMMNIIFSASNYPNFRANSGLYAGNSLYVDDVELIYASNIQKLYVDGKEWKGFNPNSAEEQVYSLGRDATTLPSIKAVRGAGSLTNAAGNTAQFSGRELSGNEISITDGVIDGTPSIITVVSEDGKSSNTYKIRFVREASSNAKLAAIRINGQELNSFGTTFNPNIYAYTAKLPYGTQTIPQITADGQEDGQTISISQPSSVTGTATIVVTAADKKTTATYTVQLQVALLADNTLKDIMVNGESIAGFTPNQTIYTVSLPTGTTTMPTVEAISAYPAGEQTIEYVAPKNIDGGKYLIKVTTPGNQVPKTYTLHIKLEASTYAKLKNLQAGDGLISNFDPDQTTYYINLPVGTTSLPEITFVKGESTQQVSIQRGGLDGITRISVVAGDGITQTEYKIVFSTAKSDISTLRMIYIGGEPLEGFAADKNTYSYTLPIGTSVLPNITFDKGDDYQTVSVLSNGLNGTTRITVVAENGSSTLYQIAFSVKQATDASLKMIYVAGTPLQDFDKEQLEYFYSLPQGTTTLPSVTYDAADEYQTITVRSGGVNGDYKITVRPQTGASRTYVLHFSVATSDNANLKMIYLDGEPLTDFTEDKLQYIDSLPIGVSTIPTVTYDKAEDGQRILSVCTNNVHTIKVTAESGHTQTYTIQFVLRRSESAYLKMIYLNGDSLPGFDKQKLNYEISLFDTICPVITVDKEEGQQITVTTPYSAGRAEIVVKPESAASNTYVIDFLPVAGNKALLSGLYVNSQSIAGFQSSIFEYTVVTDGGTTIPAITYDSNDNQYVSIFRQKDDIIVFVVAGTDKAQYTLHLNRTQSADCTLRSILIDGKQLADFSPKKQRYTVSLPTGSKMPKVSYMKQHDEQVVYAGLQNETEYSLLVVAVNGDTMRYDLHFDMALYDNANLIDLQVVGYNIHFAPTTYEYRLTLPRGLDMPTLRIKTDVGQSTEMHTVSEEEQQVIVTSQSGMTHTYRVHYTRTHSSNAMLADILVGGKSLKDFKADSFAYTDTLEWRTRVIPCVQPIGQEPNNQTITTYHSAINGTTRIHVVAADGITTQDYSILFPVRQSDNVALSSILLNSETVSINFDAETTDYHIDMPYGENMVPMVMYEGAEPEQHIQYISRPLGQTSQIIVTAENGDTRTYNLTFNRTYSTKANRLASIKIVETNQSIDIQQSSTTVNLPYGTRSMTIAYEKAFPEQTVWVQPGGIYASTIVTVKSNRPNDTDYTYTLTPQVETQNPAILTGISVDGVAIADFDPNRFSYICNRTTASTPLVDITKSAGVESNIAAIDAHHWIATVSSNGYSNTYTLFFHYPNDTIPNSDFTDWAKTSTSNSDKPAQWNAPGDYVQKIGLENIKDGVKKEGNSAVFLQTWYVGAAGSSVAAVINLADMAAKLAVAGGSYVTPSGFIGFHNTPDSVTMNYKYTSSAGDGALFRFKFFDITGTEYNFDHRQTNTDDNFADHTLYLPIDTLAVSGMDIIIDASGKYPKSGYTAKLYVDYLRFAYNSCLSGINVNGNAANRNGNTFTYDLTDAEDTQLPTLTFKGEVVDQAQQIVWQDEAVSGEFGIRNARITNYAEDGTSTNYTIEIRRPIDTRNKLKDILLDSVSLGSFTPDNTTYTIHLGADVLRLPDIQPIADGSLQQIQTAYADSTYTITVTSEAGKQTIYTIRFVTDLSDDVQLASIVADGISFAPEQTEYEVVADQMPAIKFVKKTDGQTVSLDNGVLSVIAENGNTGTYTIRLRRPQVTTTGQLAMLEINDIELQTFNSATYEYTLDRPEHVAFLREAASDSVVFVQTPAKMQWQVFGTDDQHTYTLTYPTHLSSDTYLQSILCNGESLADFDKQIFSYTIHTDSTVQLQAVAVSTAKQLVVARDTAQGANAYVFTVTAEDGTIGTPYRIDILPELSSSPYLKSITINGTPLNGFRADSLQYSIVLPTPTYKTVEPTMPSVGYEPSALRQTITMEHGALGQATYINVTSEDGTQTAQYEIVVTAEPSHCADLDGIAVNGKAIANFDAKRHYYSNRISEQDVVLTWSSQDNFQTVTQTVDNQNYSLHVVAQDGITTADYIVEIYQESASDDATLANILLDGKAFTAFHQDLNPSLKFAPMQQLYTIHIPSGTTTLPMVSATMKEDGQLIEIRQEGEWIFIDVTAPNKQTTNTYQLLFVMRKSSDTSLKMIYINGDSLSTYSADRYTYFIDLPIGQDAMPDIYAEPAEPTQTIRDSITGDLQKTIYVTAEDGSTRQYLLAFSRTFSQADTLSAIYGDGQLITGFAPHRFYYSYTLPVGTNHIPDLTWDEADKWQTISKNVIEQTATTVTTQIIVTAMSGHSNTYLVSYQIEQSSIDTLRMIYVQGDSLHQFSGTATDYSIALAPGDSVMPTVTWLEGDEYQQVTATKELYIVHNQAIGWRQTLLVEAQNGRTRVYTLLFTFSPVLSTEVGLRNIYLSGEPLQGFNPDLFTYVVSLQEDEKLPYVLAEPQTSLQTVSTQQGDTTRITVVAEDTTQYATYTIIFRRQASPYSLLAAIYQDGVLLAGFQPDSFEYEVTLPYGTTTLPAITYLPGKDGQTIDIDTIVTTIDQQEQTTLRLIVTAPDPMYSSEYDIHIVVARSNNCRLKDLQLRGTTIPNFHADSLHYDIIYPIGTDSAALASLSDIQAIAEDPQATVHITNFHADFTIVVTAPDGETSNIYTINQRILLSSNNRLESITLNGEPLYGFDPDILEYTYYISDVQPEIQVVPEDSTAQVDFSMFTINQPFNIYVTAADGSERVYTILFAETTLQSAQTPTARDVLVKHLPGTKDLVFATTRKNVSVGVYSDQGSLVFMADVPESNQNDAVVIINAEGTETLVDVRTPMVQCTLPDVNLRYFYVFFENKHRRIASGKIAVVR